MPVSNVHPEETEKAKEEREDPENEQKHFPTKPCEDRSERTPAFSHDSAEDVEKAAHQEKNALSLDDLKVIKSGNFAPLDTFHNVSFLRISKLSVNSKMTSHWSCFKN